MKLSLQEKLRLLESIEFRTLGECWEWKGGLNSSGYGTIRISGDTRGAHRVAFKFFTGEDVTDELSVCHTCDNRRCCNPTHMFLGTSQDNTADKVSKGRHAWGPHNGRAKLTEEDVLNIYEEYCNTQTSTGDLAKQYDVDQSVISDIVAGVTWRHLGLVAKTRKVGSQLKFSKLTEESVRLIRQRYATDQFTLDQLALEFGVGKVTIWKVVNRVLWKHVD